MTATLKLSNAFEPYTIELIREIEAARWTGRISSKGHAILRSPDGRATCSISPKVGDPRNKHNIARDFRRWQREQEAVVRETAPRPVEWLPWPVMPPKPEAVPAPRVACTDPGCARDFATLQAMSVHRVRAHVRVSCPICERPFSPGNLPRHQLTHDETTLPEDAARRELYRARRELAALRDEVATWQGLAEEAEEAYLSVLSGRRGIRR